MNFHNLNWIFVKQFDDLKIAFGNNFDRESENPSLKF